MKTTFTARHFEPSAQLQSHCEESAKKLLNFFDRIISCDIVLEPTPSDKTPQKVEIVLKVPRKTLKVSEASSTYEQALHDAIANLSRQLKRYKQKMTTH